MLTALLAAASVAVFVTPQDRAACKAQPDLAWCRPAQTGRPATVSDLEAVEAQARARFRFRADPEAADEWRSAADRLDSRWRGDCDDMTFTVLDLLARRGVDPSTMRRAMVTSMGNADQGAHMVGVVTTADGEMIVGDTAEGAKAPMRWAAGYYRIIATSPVSGGTRWVRP